jgi:hypothetical protein
VTLFWLLLACAMGMAVAQDAYPGASVYHDGWYNALDIAVFVIAAWQLRALQKTRAQRFSALAVAAFGAAIVVFAGVTSGLMGPDTHTVIGAPGATVRDDDAGGSFSFPLDGDPITLQRGRGTVAVGSGRRYTGSFILWQQPRTVVHVDAADARGGHLTITQPTNASFLSPVLLMQQRTTIDGMNVRFDSFSVPALQRNVKAVLFSEQQAAQLHTDPPIVGQPAVLFAVSDTSDRVVPNGIGLVPPGVQKEIGGLRLTATVQQYPVVVVASAPYWPVLLAGLILFFAGAAGLRAPRTPFRSKT